MKKNKIIYIFLFIIMLFSFNTEVNASLTDIQSVEKDIKKEEWVTGESEEMQGYCLYQLSDLEDWYGYVKKNKNSYFSLQISYSENKIEYTLAVPPHKLNEKEDQDWTVYSIIGRYDDTILNVESFNDSFNGGCPPAIKTYAADPFLYGIEYDENGQPFQIKEYAFEFSLASDDGDLWKLTNVKGVNPRTGKKLSLEGDVEFEFQKVEIENCEDLFGNGQEGQALVKLLKSLITIIKIIIPLIIIGLGTLDFVQAIFAGNEDKIKKSQQKFFKRIIIGVVIFLVPTILKLLLTLANGIWSNIDPNLCGLI